MIQHYAVLTTCRAAGDCKVDIMEKLGFQCWSLQYIPRNMHTVFALLCFVVVIHWLIFPYPSGLLHWHCGNLTIAPVPAEQPWWIWINTSCEFIMNDCITTTKQSTTKPCAYFLRYTVYPKMWILSVASCPCSVLSVPPSIFRCIRVFYKIRWIHFNVCLIIIYTLYIYMCVCIYIYICGTSIICSWK